MTSTPQPTPGGTQTGVAADTVLPRPGWAPSPQLTATLDRISVLAGRAGIVLLRCALAVVFVWFGSLKVAGHSEVAGLIHATLPWLNPHVVVPLLGYVEMLLGIGLLVGRARRLVLFGLTAHLSGTFLTFIVAPSWMFRNGDPLLLTADGEFVLKNLVLISAALVLLGVTRQSAPRIARLAELHEESPAGSPGELDRG